MGHIAAYDPEAASTRGGGARFAIWAEGGPSSPAAVDAAHRQLFLHWRSHQKQTSGGRPGLSAPRPIRSNSIFYAPTRSAHRWGGARGRCVELMSPFAVHRPGSDGRLWGEIGAHRPAYAARDGVWGAERGGLARRGDWRRHGGAPTLITRLAWLMVGGWREKSA